MKVDIKDLFMEAHSALDDLQNCHYGDQLDESAQIVAAVAAVIINHIQEEK